MKTPRKRFGQHFLHDGGTPDPSSASDRLLRACVLKALCVPSCGPTW
jgi:hypothetical protein